MPGFDVFVSGAGPPSLVELALLTVGVVGASLSLLEARELERLERALRWVSFSSKGTAD